MNEIVPPEWRNFEKYVRSLTDNNVKNQIASNLTSNYKTGEKLLYGSPDKDITFFLPIIYKDVRITNLADIKYWFYLFTLTIIFLIVEVCFLKFSEVNNLDGFLHIIGSFYISLFLIIASIVLILYVIIFNKEKILFLDANNKTLPIIPVFVTSISLILTNSILVYYSGGAKSPFLPALLFVGTIIISLPRENNRIIIFLIIITVFCFAFFIFKEMNYANNKWIEEATKINLDKFINFASFIYTIILTYILREINSNKIVEK